MSKFVIKANKGKYFNHQEYSFVHHSKGTKFKSLAQAQQVFDEILTKKPSLLELDPQIIPVEKQARLTQAEFLYLHHTLSNAEFKVYLFLLTLNPFYDRQLEVDTAVIAEHLDIARRTVQAALSRLSEIELIDWQVTRAKISVHPPQKKKDDGDLGCATAQTDDTQAQHRSPKRNPDHLGATQIANESENPHQESIPESLNLIQPISTSLKTRARNWERRGLKILKNRIKKIQKARKMWRASKTP